MKTEIFKIESLEDAALARAAAVIRGGGLVVLPTETVYGLGANALDADAAARIPQDRRRSSERRWKNTRTTTCF